MKALLLVAAVAFGYGVLQARAADFSKAKIDVIVRATGSRYGSAVLDGAREAARVLGLSVRTLGVPGGPDDAQQAQIMKSATAARPTGIVIAPADAQALAQPIAAATKAGIPVIVIASPTNTRDYATLLATDDAAAGKEAADAMARCIRRRRGKAVGKVAYLSAPARARARATRDKGFIEELKKYPRLEVVGEKAANDHPNRSLSDSERLLARHPDLAGIFADNGVVADGAGTAIAKEARAGSVCLVAFGASRDELALVRSGLIDALVVQDPYMMGYAGVWYALAAAHGVVLPKRIDTRPSVITKGDMNAPKMAGLLDPKKYVLRPFLGAP